ncbi:signal peptidase I [Gracilibacillus boraciitolerans JCM 21714]|uniref:Signal peptidase I n=1 Tax=Gracilibacillus boraciitolerans JCM 21714 TaxID=1298598 RepID=W4VL47_9BACI|nr:signal peptidase I [Gracilibacillus boraciitolerans]GAE93484.1 signal peptidase I [Gracilibacillus boraciitolerans JCM 21714]
MDNKYVKELLSWMKALVVAIIIVVICRQFLITPSVVKGESMMPNLEDGDRIILSKISHIDRFDEIAFEAPPDSDDNYVKRVIGFPGDTIEMKDDRLYVNGKLYEEAYLKQSKSALDNGETLTNDFNLKDLTGYEQVPKGKLFVLGDNRRVSKDSRQFGFIDEEAVIGDVKMRIWPVDSIGIIN